MPFSSLRSGRAWTTVGVLVLVAVVVVLLNRWLRPADQVSVTVTHVPRSTRLLFLIVDAADGPEALWWSIRKVLPSSMHPSGCTISGFNPARDSSEAGREVSWRDGARYGVVTRDADDRWRVYWFGPEEVRLRGRYWVVGGGRASVDLSRAERVEPASEELLEQVGFGPEVREIGRQAF